MCHPPSSVRSAHAVTLRNDLPFKLFYLILSSSAAAVLQILPSILLFVGVPVNYAAAWYMFVCMVFDNFILRLPVLAVLRGSILWI